jgi:gas vesicle protein
MDKRNQIIFFFLGIAVGMIAALLTSPYSGEETRQYLRERVDEGREGVEQALERGKEFVGRQTSAISNALGYGRKNFSERI